MLVVTGADAVVVDPTTEGRGDLVIRDGIVTVDEHLPRTGAQVLDATGCIVTPGLVNAHHHLLQSAFRTLPGTRGVPMSRWLAVMSAAYDKAPIDPSFVAAAAGVALAESLLCGVTTVADHQLTWPRGVDGCSLVDAVVATAARLGVRLVFVRGCSGHDPDVVGSDIETLVGALGIGHGGVTADGMVQLAVGPAGVHSDGPETFRVMAELAQRHGLRRRTQANEQVDVAVAMERYGRRPLQVLADWGWLAPDVTLAHLCAITDEELRSVAAAGASVTHAPGCDLALGGGVAPVAALLEHGVQVGLGTSGGGSNDAGHLLADARLAMQVAPLAGGALPARTAFGLATGGSANGLGRGELGTLRAGAAGDLCVWDVSGVADAGVADPVAGLLWAAPGRRPRHVVVAGRVVVRDWRLVSADEHAIVSELRRQQQRTHTAHDR